MIAALSAVYAVARLSERRGIALPMLERLGRSSLFVYWIHVELVYGYASWLWRGRLPLWGTAIAFGLFTLLIDRAVLARDGTVESWRGRRRGPTPAPRAVAV
jgi:hypothetical protein